MPNTTFSLPSVSSDYWSKHVNPFMTKVEAIAKGNKEPDLTYQLLLITQQTIHTLALGIWATAMIASSQRAAAWEDFKVSVSLTKACVVFFHHFKSLSLLVMDNLLNRELDKVKSIVLVKKYLPLFLELKKHSLPPSLDGKKTVDEETLESIEAKLNAHREFLASDKADLCLKAVICQNSVHFFNERTLQLCKFYAPDVNTSQDTPDIYAAHLPILKFLEFHINPNNLDFYEKELFDHSVDIVLNILSKAEESADMDVIKSIEKYALKWLERFAVAKEVLDTYQQVYYSNLLNGQEANFIKLFDKFNLPGRFTLLDRFPALIDDLLIRKELTTPELKRSAIKKAFQSKLGGSEESLTYKEFLAVFEKIVKLGVYDQYLVDFPEQQEELQKILHHVDFLPFAQAYELIKFYAEFYLRHITPTATETQRESAKQHLVSLVTACRGRDFDELAKKIQSFTISALRDGNPLVFDNPLLWDD